MEIKLIPARSLETEQRFDGKEFVSIDTFLSAFELDELVKVEVECQFEICYISEIQKRNERDLLRELSNKCLGKQEAHYSPIVTKDGWVYWVSGGFHRLTLETLVRIYSNGVHSNQDFLLEEGLAWHICSLRPNIIMHGSKYVPTREDRKIFELFRVEVINY